MYDIVGKRNLWFAISALLTIPGLIFIFLGGLRPSIDFTGGTEWEVRYADEPTAAEMTGRAGRARPSERSVVSRWTTATSNPTGADRFLIVGGTPTRRRPRSPSAIRPTSVGIRRRPMPAGQRRAASPRPSVAEPRSAIGRRRPRRQSPSATASPSAEPRPRRSSQGTEFAELVRPSSRTEFGSWRAAARCARSARSSAPSSSAARSILIAIGELFILGYLWIRFGFRFGTAAIVALLHDVILVVGAFAILGYFFGLEFDALFVTALLTIIGFSVHDTIVVFDRIRENRLRHAGESFGAIVNHSILQTIGRSIITSLTVVVTLGALLLLGPPTIRTFTLALLHRHRERDVLVDLQRQPDPGGLGRVGRAPQDARGPARPARSTSR